MTKPWLLVLAAVVFLAGLASSSSNRDSSVALGGVLVALVLVAAYFGTRQGVISLRSSGGAIHASTKGMTAEAAKNFIDAVEAAKNERYFAVRRVAAGAA